VRDLIHPRVEDVRPFIDAHIQLDLQQIAQCCAENTDDCILLLHDVINRMKQGIYAIYLCFVKSGAN